MQYSTTSNAALLHVIRSRPTLIGQYRQAMLELDRRTADLKHTHFLFRKQEQELKIRELKIERLKKTLENTIDETDRAELECQIKIAEIEIEEAIFNLEQTAKLIPDSERELKFCKIQIDRICKEFEATGYDLRSLDESQFQLLMGEEFRAKQLRHWSANLIAPRLGVSPDFVETMLEVPESDREYLLRANQTIMAGFLTEGGTNGSRPE